MTAGTKWKLANDNHDPLRSYFPVKSNNLIIQGFIAAVLTVIPHYPARHSQHRLPPLPASLQSFLGRWDLTLKTPDGEYPSWLELQQENGKLTARMVGRWGNARPLPKVEIADDTITFVSPKEEEGSKVIWYFKAS